ncbi:relaxase/mobilization nuclease domain-containing protein [Elizabethkingia anophelis]|uniref:relaxase/mobilization nuclease domain-containing protein n=1 Tax=Elizabethkingia anophelis TaxID=1117645 RepID=UPI003558DB3D
MNNSATTRAITKIALEYNGNDKGYAECTADNNLLSSDPKEQYREMKAVADRNSKVKKWALTGYISPPKEIGDKLSDRELTEIALEALEKVGVSDKNQYRLDIHNSTRQKHIHFIVNRVSTDGKCSVEAHDIGKRFGEAVREVCRKRNLPTDIEIGIQKRKEMLDQLIQSLKSTTNFEDLTREMAKSGYSIQLSSNVKAGVSGMRIIREEDKNYQTERQYKGGYKLSELTNRLKIEEIKEIFKIKILFREHLKTFNDLGELRQELYKAGYYLNLKEQKEQKDLQTPEILEAKQPQDIISFKDAYIKPIVKHINNDSKGKQVKDGLFFNKYSGFKYSEIENGFNIQELYSLIPKIKYYTDFQSNKVFNANDMDVASNTKDTKVMLEEIIEELLKPTYTTNTNPTNASYDDELLKRRRKKR